MTFRYIKHLIVSYVYVSCIYLHLWSKQKNLSKESKSKSKVVTTRPFCAPTKWLSCQRAVREANLTFSIPFSILDSSLSIRGLAFYMLACLTLPLQPEVEARGRGKNHLYWPLWSPHGVAILPQICPIKIWKYCHHFTSSTWALNLSR